MVIDVAEKSYVEALKALRTKEIQALLMKGWTITCYPLNRGGFLLSFDAPDVKKAKAA